MVNRDTSSWSAPRKALGGCKRAHYLSHAQFVPSSASLNVKIIGTLAFQCAL